MPLKDPALWQIIGKPLKRLDTRDKVTGQLVYGEAPYTEVPQASTTKIATTIVALEREPDLSRRIKVTISASIAQWPSLWPAESGIRVI